MAQRNDALAATLGAALAADLGTVTPGRAGGWCDDDPANDVPKFTWETEGLRFLPADVVAVPVGPRPDEALRNRRRARVEHRLGLHCGECSPW